MEPAQFCVSSTRTCITPSSSSSSSSTAPRLPRTSLITFKLLRFDPHSPIPASDALALSTRSSTQVPSGPSRSAVKLADGW